MKKERLKVILEILAIILAIGIFFLMIYGGYYIFINFIFIPLLGLIMISIP